MEMFGKDFMEFEPEDSGNRKITLSHILHYAVHTSDEGLFRRCGWEYFGEHKSIADCLESILSKQRLELYMLYIFFKGIYTFYLNFMDEDCLKTFRRLVDDKKLSTCNFHPIELIYRYIALIIYNVAGQMDGEIESIFVKAVTCFEEVKVDLSKEITILMCITYVTMWIYNGITEQDGENEYLMQMMKGHSKKSGWEELYAGLEMKESIGSILEYEYK